jgi:hypothetical protein
MALNIRSKEGGTVTRATLLEYFQEGGFFISAKLF